MNKNIRSIHTYSNIDNLIPGIRGQRAFPTREFRGSGPFLMLDHIGPEQAGKDYFLNGDGHDHPHRGFETITFMFEGQMEHRDSLGNRVSLTSGAVQRMNAGSGIIHGGDMASDPQIGRFHEVQLWVNNPAAEKMSKPDIHDLSGEEIPAHIKGHIKLRVISGILNGMEGKIKTKAATQIAHVTAGGSGIIDIGEFPEGNNVMLYVLEGNALADDTVLREFQLVVFGREGNSIQIETEHPVQLLLLSGKPLDEPVAYGGLFVMNTREEINRAHTDFKNGKFGAIRY